MTFLWRLDIERAKRPQTLRGLCWLEAAEKSTTFATFVVGKVKLRDKQKALDEISPAKSLLWSVQEHTNAPKQAEFETNARFYTTMWDRKMKQRPAKSFRDGTYRHIHAAENNSLRTDLLKLFSKRRGKTGPAFRATLI